LSHKIVFLILVVWFCQVRQSDPKVSSLKNL